MQKKKATTSAAAPNAHRINHTSAAAQRARLLAALERGPVDTVHAYRQLDILHVPRRVFELRQAGHPITTSWVWRVTEQGVRHRVGIYSLEATA
ncbi:helix-turn-helix domain-containing protein [Cupriavidus plantarum]|uniref:helix-turn-helix domain-containing protein n=1 Tax=Cupriavidus plantarum TaxID=942865 RepID=UPI000EB0F4C9|nr:helix-turn-helix domain-containing protein [Cupriavidus plantarum]RLK36107.1 helix-turn-helix protein [Cupriavidus plantarum]